MNTFAKLDVFGDQYSGFVNDLTKQLEKLSDGDLIVLQGLARSTTNTNCGWGTYGVSRLVEAEAGRILTARKTAREQAMKGS